jgi:hypothetical protein
MDKLLNVPAFGMAIGSMWSLGVLVLTWLNLLTGGAGKGWFSPFVRAFDYALPGYTPGFFGAIWGAIMAFLFGLGAGALLASIYNRFALPAAETAPAAIPAAPEDDEGSV